MTGKRRVTSQQVAKRAGVSRTTVSFVLNDVPGSNISEETRQKVFQAAAELGYVPNAAARSLVGADAVTVIPPVTGAEDFALMLQQRPGAFMFLGAGTGSGGKSPEVHTPHYDFNDAIIPLGVAYWVGVVEQEMGSAAA